MWCDLLAGWQLKAGRQAGGRRAGRQAPELATGATMPAWHAARFMWVPADPQHGLGRSQGLPRLRVRAPRALRPRQAPSQALDGRQAARQAPLSIASRLRCCPCPCCPPSPGGALLLLWQRLPRRGPHASQRSCPAAATPHTHLRPPTHPPPHTHYLPLPPLQSWPTSTMPGPACTSLPTHTRCAEGWSCRACMPSCS